MAKEVSQLERVGRDLAQVGLSDLVRVIEDEDTGDRFIVYHAESGLDVDLRLTGDSFWATQAQMADMFDVDTTVISKHLKNVFDDGDLDADSVSAKIAHTASDGKARTR